MLSVLGRGGMPGCPPCSSRAAVPALCPSDTQGRGVLVFRRGVHSSQLHRTQSCSLCRRCPLLSQSCQVWHLLTGVTLCLSSPVQDWDSSTNPHYDSVLLNLIAITRVYQFTKVQNSPKTKKGAFCCTSACGDIHSSDGNLMDQTAPGTKSCFRTRHMSVTRREVIHCCPCWCLGVALASARALPGTGVPVACVSITLSPRPSWAEKLFLLVLKWRICPFPAPTAACTRGQN